MSSVLVDTINTFDEFYVYCNGEKVSFSELMSQADVNGVIEFSQIDMVSRHTLDIFEEMILECSVRLYDESSSLYSKDGRYVIKLDENGKIIRLVKAVTADGIHISEIAKRISKGETTQLVEKGYICFIKRVDEELYIRALEESEKIIAG